MYLYCSKINGIIREHTTFWINGMEPIFYAMIFLGKGKYIYIVQLGTHAIYD